MTSFEKIYDRFLGKITDDMYLEWTPEDTTRDCENILKDAIPYFEFPRCSLIYEGTNFKDNLTEEEMNILAILMMRTWLQRQLTSVENIRMKYSGSDFKLTSQANHLSKLIQLMADVDKQDRHMQRLYKRRKTDGTGKISSNWATLFKESTFND